MISQDTEKKTLLEPALRAYSAALLAGDGRRAAQVIEAELELGRAAEDLYLGVLMEAQRDIGVQWELGRITVADEHVATQITLDEMSKLRLRLLRKRPLGLKALVGAVDGDPHVLAARVVADFLYQDGWEVDFLGNGTPIPDLLDFIRKKRPELLALSVTLQATLGNLEELIGMLAKEPWRPKLLVGGSGLSGKEDWVRSLGIDAIGSDARNAALEARRICAVASSPVSLQDVLLGLGRTIQERRKASRMSQADLARVAELDRAYISSIEHGKQNVTLAALLRLSAALGINLDELIAQALRLPSSPLVESEVV